MKISIYAYGKNLDPHNVFEGKLRSEDIKNWPSPSYFNNRLRCSPIILENEDVERAKQTFLNGDGQFEPGVQVNVAAELILHGKYRIYQQFDKDELILMLASILKKSDVPAVAAEISRLAGD